MNIKEYNKYLIDDFYKKVFDDKILDADDLYGLTILKDSLLKMKSVVDAKYENCNCGLMFVEAFANCDYEENTKKPNNKTEGFVYIAKQLNENNIYKIGITNNITKRGNTFKTGNAFVEMVASLKTPKYKDLEKQLHFRERENRFKGEWFNLDKDQLDKLISDYKFNIHLGNNNA
jgi:predicted GIY-YIG superfamily endonuclease